MQTSAKTTKTRSALPDRVSTPARAHFGEPGTADPATLPYTCRCGARWGGLRTCHCPTCHRNLSGVGPFDQHRRNGQCIDPADLGMVLLPGRPYDVWGNTSDEASRE